jgi:hypothetical protein
MAQGSNRNNNMSLSLRAGSHLVDYVYKESLIYFCSICFHRPILVKYSIDISSKSTNRNCATVNHDVSHDSLKMLHVIFNVIELNAEGKDVIRRERSEIGDRNVGGIE